ncbi:MAG: hypothetical protein QJR08_07090 [Bacillota bacterium]|nr:hypothetical protein [Bacillota bacterium]
MRPDGRRTLELRRKRLARLTAGWVAASLTLFGGAVAWAGSHTPQPARPAAARSRTVQAALPPQTRKLLEQSRELDARIRAAQSQVDRLSQKVEQVAGQAAALPPPAAPPSLPPMAMPQVQTTTGAS